MKIEKWPPYHNLSPQKQQQIPSLMAIILGPTEINKAGRPILAEKSYLFFLDHFSYLHKKGQRLLELLKFIKNFLTQPSPPQEFFTPNELNSALAAITVLKRVILTASITAPADLWLARHIFSTFKKLGLSQKILEGQNFTAKKHAMEFQWDETCLEHHLKFLYSRGHLIKEQKSYTLNKKGPGRKLFSSLELIPAQYPPNMVPQIANFLQNKGPSEELLLQNFFTYEKAQDTHLAYNWIADRDDIEISFRLLPLVLACRSLNIHEQFKEGISITLLKIHLLPNILTLLVEAGAVAMPDYSITALGERIFNRGPGPFGIIHAYYAYMEHLPELIKGNKEKIWVARGENVAASQDANAKTFAQINRALDEFTQKYAFSYDIFIEHAVGQGEATRQRFQLSGEKTIQYYGADLEDSAIDKAISKRKQGELPQNMLFLRRADIGRPEALISYIQSTGKNVSGAVMVVGNGFHEVRHQNNQKMIDIFKGYAHAGIILIFTEESGLRDEDLIHSAWNTYHAGFRFVHDLSGQGLRPALDVPEGDQTSPYSWKKCVSLAGYKVLEEFTTRTRTIYPHPKKGGHNPSISVSYFCVPTKLSQKLKAAQ